MSDIVETLKAWDCAAGNQAIAEIERLRARLAEVEAEHAAFSNNVEQCEAENDCLRELLRKARPIALGLLQVIKDASAHLPPRAPVNMRAATSATDALLAWLAAIDAALERNPSGERDMKIDVEAWARRELERDVTHHFDLWVAACNERDALRARLAEAEARADRDVIERNRVIAEKSARLAEADKANQLLRADIAAQSREEDLILMALRLDPERYRTECGYLNVPKIVAAIKNPDMYPRTTDSASACTCDGEYKYDGDCPVHGDPSFASDQPSSSASVEGEK